MFTIVVTQNTDIRWLTWVELYQGGELQTHHYPLFTQK